MRHASFSFIIPLFLSIPFMYLENQEHVALSSINPHRTVLQQIRYMRKNWRDQFAVAVVETTGEAKKAAESKGTTYWNQEVMPVELIFVRWLDADPRAPGNRFHIHYWTRPKKGEKELKAKEQRIVFMAPARAQGVLATEMILPADKKMIEKVRKMLKEMIP